MCTAVVGRIPQHRLRSSRTNRTKTKKMTTPRNKKKTSPTTCGLYLPSMIPPAQGNACMHVSCVANTSLNRKKTKPSATVLTILTMLMALSRLDPNPPSFSTASPPSSSPSITGNEDTEPPTSLPMGLALPLRLPLPPAVAVALATLVRARVRCDTRRLPAAYDARDALRPLAKDARTASTLESSRTPIDRPTDQRTHRG